MSEWEIIPHPVRSDCERFLKESELVLSLGGARTDHYKGF